MARGAMGPARTGRGSGRDAMDRRSTVPGVGRRSTARATARGVGSRSTARATARDRTAPVPMARDGSSPVPPVPAARRNRGGDLGRGMIAAVPAARAGRTRGGRRVRGRIAVVRGPDRAIDSDRGRGHDRGIGGRKSVMTGRATNHGGRTTAGQVRVGTTAIDQDRPPAIAQVTDRVGEVRPVAGRSAARPAAAAVAARVRIDRIASARKAGARTNGHRSSVATGVRRDPRRCHRQTRSATKRNSSRAGVRSKRRSSLGARPSVFSWSHSVERPSRRSCSTPRTCASRSSRSKGAH